MKYDLNQSVLIETTSDKLVEFVHDLTQWSQWSPWLCLDTEASVTFENENQSMNWQSDVIGVGSMSICETSDSHLLVDLTFLKPFKSTAQARLEWQPKNDGYEVVWTMLGKMPWYLFFLIPMMKGWVRMDYRRGLARLKALCEQGCVPARLDLNKEVRVADKFTFIGIRHQKVAYAEMPEVMEKDFIEISEQLNLGADANYIALYDKVSVSDDTFDFAAGVFYASAQEAPEKPKMPGWEVRHIPEHKVLEVELTGPYDHLGDAWSMAMMHIKPLGLKMNKKIASYEVYLSGAQNCGNPKEFKTRVSVPVK